jgi:hypothetical protein
MRKNNFNVPDKDHTGHTNFKTVLKDIATMNELGFAFNGKHKVVKQGNNYRTSYYVAHQCGCSSYRTISSLKKSKTFVCGDCTYNLTRRQISDNTRNYHVKKKDFYESLLIEGAKVLDVIHKRDNSNKLLYMIRFKCACGTVVDKRPADITRYYKPRLKKPAIACADCGHFIGHNYGDYAPIKTMLKKLEKGIENVTGEGNQGCSTEAN